MSDARWFEIEDDLAAAVLHFRRSQELAAAGGFDADTLDGYRAQMALMHAMQSGHTSLESMLVRILALLGEDAPSGASWHADLITRVARALPARPAILHPDLAAAANETRRFRHVAMRNYGTFNATLARPAIEAAQRLAADLPRSVATFKAVIDTP